MNWTTVQSSNIWRIAYDTKTKKLYIVFVNKKQSAYCYQGVPANIATALKKAHSVGEYFADNIKDVYQFSIQSINTVKF